MRFSLVAIWAFGNIVDLTAFSIFFLSKNWATLSKFVTAYVDPGTLLNTLKCSLSALALIQVIRFMRGLSAKSNPVEDGLPKPMLFPCRTSHTRLFPKKNTFSYSYLLAGVPIGWKGSSGGMLSADLPKKNTPWYWKLLSITPDPASTWYSVDADDYMEPGHVELGLDGKLWRYLETQGAQRKDFPYVYLVTAAKFMGYVSNPVSFWHLYGPDKELKAFVVEVNNTFNERHMYFSNTNLGVSDTSDIPQDTDFDWQNIEQEASSFDKSQKLGIKDQSKFRKHWSKDFYVSPFNSRKGSYSQLSYDPLFPALTGNGPVNTTLTLNSSKAHAKLVARVFSTKPAVDPSTMSLLGKIRFLAMWWWVGLATFPRTVYQAGILLFKRKMTFLLRPEPTKDTIGRQADDCEIAIESAFRSYLRHLVEQADLPVVVKYIPGGLPGSSEELMNSPAAQLAPHTVEVLEFKVLTPLFYSRFVHYADNLDALHHEFNESRTIWLSNSLILLDFLPSSAPALDRRFAGRWDQACFGAIRNLRARPAPIKGPMYAKDSNKLEVLPMPKPKVIQDGSFSALDEFVLQEASPLEHAEYRRGVLKLFLSDHLALGDPSFLGLELFIIKAAISWAVVKSCTL
ncbi:hypothetical protein BP6252_12406 [Coleophoma cylindrospora]|uniref:DUF1365-domain-containing protein n=1 Tax=Coleophoma cylindrospora TaxID=1849047 RepID=A0A3D8QGR2_9HELO|nr:hypothetical protein BP6252_12406 [Coleophoma cylindrospora]